MVVKKMMRWPRWPPPSSKKFQVKVVVLRLHGLRPLEYPDGASFTAELSWKGTPRSALTTLRRTVRKNCTKEAQIAFPSSSSPSSSSPSSSSPPPPPPPAAAAACDDDDDDDDRQQRLDSALGKVEWNEEFLSVCTFTSTSSTKDKEDLAFHPWQISFLVFNGPCNVPRNKSANVGMALMNLAKFAPASEKKEIEIQIPLTSLGNSTDTSYSLHLALSFVEVKMPPPQDSSEMVQRTIGPILSPPQTRDGLPPEKDEISALKAGLRKVKMLKEYVSKSKKIRQGGDDASDERFSVRSDDVEYTYSFDSDSMDDDNQKGELEDGKYAPSIRKSFSYGTLASANYVGGSFYLDMRINGEYEDWIYYSHRRSDVGCSQMEDTSTSTTNEQSSLSVSKRRSILPWKRRRLTKPKGEPLLKPYGEDGGDDIDYDRRQMSSSDESLKKMDEDVVANGLSVSEFGEDSFVIGSWETREVTSRDGHMKLSSQVFFASIDQRSERAAGESACTALVAVIASWFQANRELMPIQSQFDSLIRDGSLEWRKLCENEIHRERFPDKHFDLETVLQAKIRPLSVVPDKSFIGFFHPEEEEDAADTNADANATSTSTSTVGSHNRNGFEFLDGAMSFDGIWEEIRRAAQNGDGPYDDGRPQVYIVSWNDHFFILKVEPHAYYIIDTLGERLYEGCTQAYILKFDENTSIRRMPPPSATKEEENSITVVKEEHDEHNKHIIRHSNSSSPLNEKEHSSHSSRSSHSPQSSHSSHSSHPSHSTHPPPGEKAAAATTKNGDDDGRRDEDIVCHGKESCKEYIKNFLAAIPIRELQGDMKRGLLSSTPIHHRLQVEFHYTWVVEEASEEAKDVAQGEAKDVAQGEAKDVAQEEAKDVAQEEASEEVKDVGQEEASEEVKDVGQEEASEEVKDVGQEEASEEVKDVGQEEASEEVKDVGQEEASEEVKDVAQEEASEKVKDVAQEEASEEEVKEVGQEEASEVVVVEPSTGSSGSEPEQPSISQG